MNYVLLLESISVICKIANLGGLIFLIIVGRQWFQFHFKMIMENRAMIYDMQLELKKEQLEKETEEFKERISKK